MAARYAHCPKRSHELALAQVGKYLKGAAGKGLLFKPSTTDFKMGVLADAALAGGWGSEPPANPDSVKPRAGCALEVASCPVLWVSKLQPAIATSTMEAEYTALSMPLRAAIPLIDLPKQEIGRAHV